MDKGTNKQAMEGAAASKRSNVSLVNEPVEKRIEVIKRKMKATTDDQGRNTRMKDCGELGDEAMRMEEIGTTPKGTGRSGEDLKGSKREWTSKLAIHILEGKKRPKVPLQAAKLATEGGIVLRWHIPVLPHWKMYRDEREREHLVNYINKVFVQFSMDTTSKPVISACAHMMKCSQRQMRYKLKKKFFNNIPVNDVVVKFPMPSMNDNQWEALVVAYGHIRWKFSPTFSLLKISMIGCLDNSEHWT
ncbi:hypothetical protein EJB05_49926, partial [Eragrostis curvula]